MKGHMRKLRYLVPHLRGEATFTGRQDVFVLANGNTNSPSLNEGFSTLIEHKMQIKSSHPCPRFFILQPNSSY